MKTIFAAILGLAIATSVQAQSTTQSNVDLSTVPERETVQLTIYNSEDLTLVRETRKVSFKKGVNPLQFSWANTLIDPTSVRLRFATHPERLELLDTTFPHTKPQMLYWNVQSEMEGEATVEITYFTSGIRWSADYLCTANLDETEMGFEGFVRVFNNSGEEYEDAHVRLVVGKINLVEKIAQLAQILPANVPELPAGKKRDLREEALRLPMSSPQMGFGGGMAALKKPKEIVKEGLSEYFIYTIEGTETIPNGWSSGCGASRAKRALQDPVPLPGQRIWGPTRPYVPPDQRQGVETGDDASARRHGSGLPAERPRRALVSGRPANQVRPDWGQDRIEPRPRPRGPFRVGEAEDVAGQPLGANPGRRPFPTSGRARSARSRSTVPSSAGTTTRSSPSGSATTRKNRSTWRSAARCPAISSSAVRWGRRTSTSRPLSTMPW